jgi:hypothetical protein
MNAPDTYAEPCPETYPLGRIRAELNERFGLLASTEIWRD